MAFTILDCDRSFESHWGTLWRIIWGPIIDYCVGGYQDNWLLCSKALEVKELLHRCSDADVRLSLPWLITFLARFPIKSNILIETGTTLFHQLDHGYVLAGGSPLAKHSWPSIGCQGSFPL